MKVYRIEECGEVTHIAFDGNKKEAREWYLEECMSDENEISSFSLFPRKKWKDITVKFDEYNIEPFTMTIEEMMEGNTSNEVICSTAFL